MSCISLAHQHLWPEINTEPAVTIQQTPLLIASSSLCILGLSAVFLLPFTTPPRRAHAYSPRATPPPSLCPRSLLMRLRFPLHLSPMLYLSRALVSIFPVYSNVLYKLAVLLPSRIVGLPSASAIPPPRPRTFYLSTTSPVARRPPIPLHADVRPNHTECTQHNPHTLSLSTGLFRCSIHPCLDGECTIA